MRDGRVTEATVADTVDAQRIRLHISPLDADLLKAVLPAAILPNARNISFHTIQAFPDKRYGFVDLPVADAEKIKKRLNGAVLKGAKVRIETARPDDMPSPAGSAALADPAEDATKKERKSKRKEKAEKSKKRKRDAKEVEGVVLEEGRKVKRGWTVPAETLAKMEKDRRKDKKKDKKDKKARKKEAKSEYTDGPECLVKTVLPPNVAANLDESSTKKRKKGKKSRSREVVVHEFEHNSKFPTFLKSTDTQTSHTDLEFVDGKGWVDAEGDIVEPMKVTRAAAMSSKPTLAKADRKPKSIDPPVIPEDDETSSSGSSSEDESTEEENPSPAPKRSNNKKELRINPAKAKGKHALSDSTANIDSPQPKSASSVRSLTIKIPPPPTTPAAKVHPLEALYKRGKEEGDSTVPAASTAEPFSFFGANNEAEEQEGDEDSRRLIGSQPPMTPFTQQDFEWRNLRSAAPTPDTAHINKTFKFWPRDGGDDDIEEEDEQMDQHEGSGETPLGGAIDVDKPESAPAASTDFQEWFWQNRGDLNRSWRKRRKTAAKEKRYRENKARANRAI